MCLFYSNIQKNTGVLIYAIEVKLAYINSQKCDK